MKVLAGIENNNDDRTIFWALEHPGCFAYGRDSREAEENFHKAVKEYAAWTAAHGEAWIERGEIEIAVVGTFEVYFVNQELERVPRGKEASMIESFFLHDWKPLRAAEIERAKKLLAWSRDDLVSVIKGLSPQKLDQTYKDERWSINGILDHVAGAEWWYQERIGFPFPEHEQDLPIDPFECLRLVRDHFISLLPKLEGLHRVVGLGGELWSPRKALRRAAWHERDHTEHIRNLI